MGAVDVEYVGAVYRALRHVGITAIIEGSVLYGIRVRRADRTKAIETLKKDAHTKGYRILWVGPAPRPRAAVRTSVGASFVPPLAQGKLTDAPLVFGNVDPEIDLVRRYLDSRHVHYSMSMGLTVGFFLDGFGRHPVPGALLNGYERQFGVNLRLRGPGMMVVVPFARVSTEGAGMRISAALRNVWARDSMLWRAVRQAVARGQVHNSDHVVACTYILRPWLSARYRRTEVLQGALRVKRKGHSVSALLLYENGTPLKR